GTSPGARSPPCRARRASAARARALCAAGPPYFAPFRCRRRLAISMAASTASTPLSVRSRACSMVSHVRMPNPRGTPVSTERAPRAHATVLPRTSWCVVSPRMIAARATSASGLRVSSMARTPAGTSKAPGTRATMTSETLAPRRRRLSSADASSASGIVGFQRAHTTPKPRPRASRPPSKRLGEKAAVARRGARMLKDRSSLKSRHCNPSRELALDLTHATGARLAEKRLDRAPDPALRSRSRGARLLPRLLRETPRAANQGPDLLCEQPRELRGVPEVAAVARKKFRRRVARRLRSERLDAKYRGDAADPSRHGPWSSDPQAPQEPSAVHIPDTRRVDGLPFDLGRRNLVSDGAGPVAGVDRGTVSAVGDDEDGNALLQLFQRKPRLVRQDAGLVVVDDQDRRSPEALGHLF